MQGRKSRRRSPDDIEHLIKEHYNQGFRWFFVTDDNFARNKDWEDIFDRIILLRERDGIAIKMVIQVDTLCHKIPNFIDKAARAGAVTSVASATASTIRPIRMTQPPAPGPWL